MFSNIVHTCIDNNIVDIMNWVTASRKPSILFQYVNTWRERDNIIERVQPAIGDWACILNIKYWWLG